MAGFNELSAKQQAAILALLQQPTITEAARAAGCGERTIHRWLQQLLFQQAYREARREAVTQAMAQLQRLTGEAVQTLRNVIRDPESSGSAKVTAAKLILDYGVRDNFEERLQELEQRLQEIDLKRGGREAWQETAAVIGHESE